MEPPPQAAPPPAPPQQQQQPTADAPIAVARPRRQRKTRQFLSDDEYEEEFYDGTGQRPAPKIKLKIGGGGGGGGPAGTGGQSSRRGRGHHAGQGGGASGPGVIGPAGLDMSGVGWDRELDSDTEEPLAVEEQFILRVPDDVAPKLRAMVEARNVTQDVWFKFKDSRRAVFHFGDKLFGAKLVDLPALIESQKLRGQGGQTIKVADISQMLLVEQEVKDEADVTRDKQFNAEDFIFPHGITPPLRHVRKRRFRKRHDKKAIEIVEAAVERLLEKDSHAEQVQLELLDHEVPSEDEYDNEDQGNQRGHAGDGASLNGAGASGVFQREGTASSVPDGADDGGDRDGGAQYDEDEDGQQSEDAGAGSGYDSDLANEINKGMAALEQSMSEDESGSDAGGLFGESGTDDDEEQEDQTTDPVAQEQKKRIKLLLEETGDLDRAIQSKEAELAKAANPIFKKRFEEMIKKLTNERDLKRTQHAKAVAELEKRQAAVRDAQDAVNAATQAASNAAAAAGGGGGAVTGTAAADTGAGAGAGATASTSASGSGGASTLSSGVPPNPNGGSATNGFALSGTVTGGPSSAQLASNGSNDQMDQS